MTVPSYVSLEDVSRLDHEDRSSRVIHDDHREQAPYEVAVNPAVLTFGSFSIGAQSAYQTITVRNIGYLPIPIVAVTAVGEDFVASNDAPLILQPGISFSILVMFAPRTGGTCSGGVYIDVDIKARGERFVQFNGTGVS